MEGIDIINGIKTLAPGARFMRDYELSQNENGTYYFSKWNDQFGEPPTYEELEVARLSAEAIRISIAYQRKRKREYPPVEDYLDGIVKGDQVQIQAYIDACLAVKTKYPKP